MPKLINLLFFRNMHQLWIWCLQHISVKLVERHVYIMFGNWGHKLLKRHSFSFLLDIQLKVLNSLLLSYFVLHSVPHYFGGTSLKKTFLDGTICCSSINGAFTEVFCLLSFLLLLLSQRFFEKMLQASKSEWVYTFTKNIKCNQFEKSCLWTLHKRIHKFLLFFIQVLQSIPIF